MGISDSHAVNKVNLSPNPVKAGQSITVRNNALIDQDSQISIIDISGKLIRKINVLSTDGFGQIEISTSGFTPGYYQLVFKAVDGHSPIAVRKLIVQ